MLHLLPEGSSEGESIPIFRKSNEIEEIEGLPIEQIKGWISNKFFLVLALILAVAAIAKVGSIHRDATGARSRSVSSSLVKTPSARNYCVQPSSGPVLKGYDLVEYHNLSPGDSAVKGSPDLKTLWGSPDGKLYEFHFAKRENLHKFTADPNSYLPAYGGFCAWGIATEDIWSTANLGPPSDPDVWSIINGKLYLFMYIEPKQQFLGVPSSEEEEEGDSDVAKTYISDADQRWSSWTSTSGMLFNTDCFWQESLKGGTNGYSD